MTFQSNKRRNIKPSFLSINFSISDCVGNLALGNVVSQISTQYNGVAFRAIDGRWHGHYYKDYSCSHTRRTLNPWWTVDLGGNETITRVVIVNRGDCCGTFLID